MATEKNPQRAPAFVVPMAATAVKQLPEGNDWLYEVKWDGYRALIIKNGDRVLIQSRNHKDLTPMYPGIAAAAQRLAADRTVLDGEIVALDESGRPAFQALQHRGSNPKHWIVLYAFDVLHMNGRDLAAERIEKRRALLPTLVGQNPVIRVSGDLPGTAAQVIEAVRSLGLEGVRQASRVGISAWRALERLAEVETSESTRVRDRRVPTGWARY